MLRIPALLSLVVVSLPLAGFADSPPEMRSELTARGREVRGVYLSGPYLRTRGHRGIAKATRASRLDAVVIDIKDERGQVLFPTKVPGLQKSRHVLYRDLPGMVREPHETGHYVIGRIVCFKDDALAEARPDLAVRDERTGRIWTSISRSHWVDPAHHEVVQNLVGLSKEVQDIGFDEVQYDYIRYPVDFRSDFATFPTGEDEILRRHVISWFLERADAALSIPISVDVFGLTVYRDGDPSGLGQSIEDMAPHIEVLSPMLYASDFTNGWVRSRAQHPIATIVWTAVRAARRRVGDRVAIRPYLQAFRFRAPDYGPSFMRSQIAAARSAGADGFLFWNAGCSYGTVFESLAGLGPMRR